MARGTPHQTSYFQQTIITIIPMVINHPSLADQELEAKTKSARQEIQEEEIFINLPVTNKALLNITKQNETL